MSEDGHGKDEPTALLEVVKELDYGIDLSHLEFKKNQKKVEQKIPGKPYCKKRAWRSNSDDLRNSRPF